MPINKLVIEKGNSVEIEFQSIIDLSSFEALLKIAYPKSKKATAVKIKFNFRSVTWCDILQLSMISLWILELKLMGKDIEVAYPINQRLVAFLDNYDFTDFLKENEIRSNRALISIRIKLNHRPFLPLTFANENKFKEILQNLSIPKYYSTLFKEVEYYSVAKKGVIRDIVVKELGDNAYIHGEGKLANLVVTKTTPIPKDRRNTLIPKKEVDTIYNKPYISVVISDKGKGISKTLMKAYREDTIISPKKAPSSSDIIEYSTLEHSTSRTTQQRVNTIKELITSEAKDINPFTGLFYLKDIVRKYLGILTIRSGNSFVVFNYYEKKGDLTVYKSENIRGYKSLANFGGTQVKVVLPILEDYKEIEDKLYGSFNFQEADEKTRYKYIAASDFLETSKGETELFENCSLLISEIKRSSLSPEFDSIILDFKTSLISLDSKIKVLIIYQLMKCQEVDNKTHTVINVDSTLVDLINHSLENKSHLIDRPLICFTNKYQRDIMGVFETERQLFLDIQRTGFFANDEMSQFANKYKALFVYNKITDKWDFRHNRTSILSTLRKNIEDKLQKIILDPTNSIYYNDTKVLAPTGVYFDRYFEIYTLTQNIYWKEKIKHWLLLSLHEIKPSHLISISIFMGEVVSEVLRETEISRLKRIVHINLKSPLDINKAEVLDLNYLSDVKKIVLCTDVIATGKTLLSLLDILSDVVISDACCIVNLMGSNFLKPEKGNTLNISSILQVESKGHTSKPSHWKYDDINSVDNNSHKLVITRHPGISQFKEPIFESPLTGYSLRKNIIELITKGDTRSAEPMAVFENPFFENIVIPYYAFFSKVISENKYMPIMFNIPFIVTQVANEIKSDITQAIDKIKERYSISINNIIIAGDMGNYTSLLTLLYQEHPTIDFLNISYNHLDISDNSTDFNGSGVIVLDDAFISGENYFKFLDYCSNRNAGFVLVYILVKRSSDKISNRLKQIRKYGDMVVEFKYLFEGRIPVYSELNNAITKHIADYKTLKEKFENLAIVPFLQERISFLQYRNFLQGFASGNSQFDYNPQYIRIRWKLELADNEMGVRREFAHFFEDDLEHDSEIFILFSIIVEEKYTFLLNTHFITNFFYEKFRKNVVKKCILYLIERKRTLLPQDINNIVEILYRLDWKEFDNFINNDLSEQLDKEALIFSIICVLFFSKKSHNSLRLKFDFLSVLKKENSELEHKGFLPLINHLETVWKNEEAELSRYDLQKVNYIKTLLKSSFHDLSQKVQNLRIYLESDIPRGVLILEDIIAIIRTSFGKIKYLMLGDNFQEVSLKINDNLKRLELLIAEGLTIIDAVAESKEKTAQIDNILACAFQMEDCIFSQNGIIKTLDMEFRTDLKKEIATLFKPILIKEGLQVEIKSVDDSCVVFCLRNDLLTIISNIRDNIIKHSKATRVFVELTKKNQGLNQFVLLRIYDNGPNVEEISPSHGISKCISLSKLYSGDCKIGKLNDTDLLYSEGYRTYAFITLHDLSTDILNIPIYGK